MNFKNSSKSKLTLAFISIVITFFVWQQGLRDSLNRPSVSFDISQKEQEIAELSVQSIPVNFKKFFIHLFIHHLYQMVHYQLNKTYILDWLFVILQA